MMPTLQLIHKTDVKITLVASVVGVATAAATADNMRTARPHLEIENESNHTFKRNHL